MALCRCIKHHSPPQSRRYVAYVEPVRESDVITVYCGINRCSEPGVIWLEKSEARAYEDGERLFAGPSNFVKIKAADSGLQTFKQPGFGRMATEFDYKDRPPTGR